MARGIAGWGPIWGSSCPDCGKEDGVSSRRQENTSPLLNSSLTMMCSMRIYIKLLGISSTIPRSVCVPSQVITLNINISVCFGELSQVERKVHILLICRSGRLQLCWVWNVWVGAMGKSDLQWLLSNAACLPKGEVARVQSKQQHLEVVQKYMLLLSFLEHFSSREKMTYHN